MTVKTQTRRLPKTAKTIDNSPAERIVNDDPKLHAIFDVPSVSHQGDIIIVALPALPKTRKLRTNRQLAEGDTQGSRHILKRGKLFDADKNEVVKLIADNYKHKDGKPIIVNTKYVGPVFVSPKSPNENDISHPEHGDQGFPAGTICAVVYQRSLDAELREQRVAD